MLTEQDIERLEILQKRRFKEIYPEFAPFLMGIDRDRKCLKLNCNSQPQIYPLISKNDLLLEEGAAIFGTIALEIFLKGEFMFAADLELNSISVAKEASMPAILEKENPRAVEFEVTKKVEVIVPWSQIAPRIAQSEDQLKLILSDKRVPFMWAENGEWGIDSSEAKSLIQDFYNQKAQEEIFSLLGATQQQEIEEKPIKKTKTKLPPIKLQAEYKPTSKLSESCRRYLEAIAPDDETQLFFLNEIQDGGKRGKEHIKLALSGYEEGKAPSEEDLKASFARLRDRLLKKAQN